MMLSQISILLLQTIVAEKLPHSLEKSCVSYLQKPNHFTTNRMFINLLFPEKVIYTFLRLAGKEIIKSCFFSFHFLGEDTLSFSESVKCIYIERGSYNLEFM